MSTLLTFLAVACSTVEPPQYVQAAEEPAQYVQTANEPAQNDQVAEEPVIVQEQPVDELATVTSIEIQPYADGLSTVMVWVTGPLPDLCTQLGLTYRKREGNTIIITLYVEPNPGPFCGDGSPVEFGRGMPLADLEPGSYTIIANGFSKEFELTESGLAP